MWSLATANSLQLLVAPKHNGYSISNVLGGLDKKLSKLYCGSQLELRLFLSARKASIYFSLLKKLSTTRKCSNGSINMFHRGLLFTPVRVCDDYPTDMCCLHNKKNLIIVLRFGLTNKVLYDHLVRDICSIH